jgi:hypothetical protein
LLLVAVACSERHPQPVAPQPEPPPAAATPHQVLFIGNSLTEANELPSMVEGLAHAVGIDSFTAVSIAIGGYSLEDHLARGSAGAVTGGMWDVVVLQQGPSTQPESRTQLRRDVRIFADLAAQVGARIGIYGVWTPEAALQYLNDGIESYRLAAEDVNGLLFPVGAAWREAWRLDPTVELYDEDRFHPSIKGTYLAALVIAAQLFQRPPSDFPGQFRYGLRGRVVLTLTDAETALFRNAAAAALE